MSKKITSYSILIILIIGLIGAGGLVLEEFETGESCPKTMHITMCYYSLLLFSSLIALKMHHLTLNNQK